MVLVVGATGLLGREVCRRLAVRNHPVRALVRTTSVQVKIDALRGWGASIVTGDLKDRASLERAVAGATTIVSTASSTLSREPGDSIDTVDREGQLNLVEAARRAGIERFIFVSFRNNPNLPSPLSAAKRAVENAIRDMNFTSIQASFFMEVWLSPALGFDYANAAARIYGDGHARISWVSFQDVAEFCVAAVENPATQRRVIEFGGPEPLSPLQVVRIFEEEGGRKFQVDHVPEAAMREQFESAGDSLQKSFAALMLGWVYGDKIDMSAMLKEFPMQMTSVREYARQVLRPQATSA